MTRRTGGIKVFSFRDDDSVDVRSNYDHHDIRILSVEDDGDMDFLVYGYMNRGNHEGEKWNCRISLYGI